MGARQKLNVGYTNGALIVAAVLGLVCQSWVVFLLVAGLGLGMSLYLDEIRP